MTPESPSGVVALQPIVVKRPQDIGNYYNAINFLRDRGWIDHQSITIAPNEVGAMQITQEGLAELERRHVRY